MHIDIMLLFIPSCVLISIILYFLFYFIKRPKQTGIKLIIKEQKKYRHLKIQDDENTDDLIRIAIAYGIHGLDNQDGKCFLPKGCLWFPVKHDPQDMGNSDRLTHLIRSGALIASEIDRLSKKIR